MFEHFTTGAPENCPGSPSDENSSSNTCFPARSTLSSPSNTKQCAQSPLSGLTSQFDNPESSKNNISSSNSSISSNPLEASVNEITSQVDLAATFECEDELVVDPDENGTESKQASLSALHLCRRLQKEANSQQLFTQSQVISISGLVEEMISNQSQCHVTASSLNSQSPSDPLPTPPSENPLAVDNIAVDNMDDEGFCEGETISDEEIDTEALLTSLRQVGIPPGIRRAEHPKDWVFVKPRVRRKIARRKRREDQLENAE